jgi:aspartyl-tRNA(Asn)/glutamyl-tRNA(Gln) amidotransferase subunit A
VDDKGLVGLTLSEASGLIAARELSPVELTEACIARAERFDPTLHAFLATTFDTALKEAQVAEDEIGRGGYRGALHGIPFGLKDLYETAGVRTTAGSLLRADYVPAEDAEAVRRLKDAGCVLMGKLNTHEWALGTTNVNQFFPSPRNPWDTSRITGGSSGGSGVAIAARFCLGTLGSDTRGSIRIPSSLCGITGLKPTYGRVSLRGVVPLNWSLDHAGPMAASAGDCARILQAIAGFDPLDPTSVDAPVPDYAAQLGGDLKGVRIGVPHNYFFDDGVVDHEVAIAVLASRQVFDDLGAKVETVTFPEPDRYQDEGAFLAEGEAYHEERLRDHPELFGEQVRSRFLGGAAVSGVDYARARYRQMELQQAMRELFKEVDLILTPTTIRAAMPFPDNAGMLAIPPGLLARNAWPFNFAGIPAISVPCGFTSEGLPIGLQLAGRWWEEGLVLRTGDAYQGVTDWHRRRPPLE